MTLLQLDLKKVLQQFPIFNEPIHDQMLIYLDSAATTQKPKKVVDVMSRFYMTEYATVHRGIYELSMEATERYDEAREKVKEFINAKGEEEIIFTKGTTDAINLVALSYGEKLKKNDEIIISEAEHHSNIIPWQLLAKRKGVKIKVIPIDDQGNLILSEYAKLLNDKTKIVSIAHIFNALGTINPIKKITQMAHENGAVVFIDGAQAISHIPIDVQDINCDFYAFSSHKAYGPTGIGVLYGKYDLLEKMEPMQGGGDMIDRVTLETSTFLKPPLRFEAGTPAIAEAIGLKEAISFMQDIGIENLYAHESHLLTYATEQLNKIEGLTIYGNAEEKSAIINCAIKGIHPLDLGTFLDLRGIAVRTGHHCAQPALRRYGLESSMRISFGVYNTIGEIDRFIAALHDVIAHLRA